MNTENLTGVLIKWNKPAAERDYNNLKTGVDFTVLNYNKNCPVTDGSPVTFVGVPDADLYEWLVKERGAVVEGIDYDLFIQNIVERPTMVKSATFINYNVWLTETKTVRRTDAELKEVIKAKENEANNSILNEAERNKMQMIGPAVNAKIAAGLILNATEQAVYDRMIEIAAKAQLNAANAASLYVIVDEGGTPDLKSGWEYNNVTAQGFPFS